MGIILSCVITLTLCVWTAIHLNVVTRPSKSRILAFKSVWVILGMLAPDFVLWIAFRQYMQARHVREALTHPYSERGNFVPFQKFNMKMAYFATMGGYGLDVAPEDRRKLPLTISSSLFVDLCHNGIIRERGLDEKIVDDKSKADEFAKLIVCVQTFV